MRLDTRHFGESLAETCPQRMGTGAGVGLMYGTGYKLYIHIYALNCEMVDCSYDGIGYALYSTHTCLELLIDRLFISFLINWLT